MSTARDRFLTAAADLGVEVAPVTHPDGTRTGSRTRLPHMVTNLFWPGGAVS